MIALALAAGLEVFPSYSDVRAIVPEERGALILTTGGAYRITPEGFSPAEGAAPPSSRSSVTLSGFPLEGRAGGFAATFGGGLLDSSLQRVPGSPDVVAAVVETPVGLLFGGPRGLFRLEKGVAEPAGRPGLPDGHVVALAKGGDTLWVATFDGGLSSYKGGTWRSWTEADGLPSDWLDDLAWDGEKLWAVGDKGVFWVIDGLVKRAQSEQLRKPGSALHFYNGVMHVAQEKALVLVKGQDIEVLPIPEKNPQDLWVDESGIWLAGLEGLYRFKDRKMGFYHGGRGLPANWVTAVTRASEGIVAGTYDQGLSTLKGDRLLPQVWVNLKALASQGEFLAAGGMEEGLWLRRGKEWTRLRRSDGLPGDDVSALLFDGGRLWIGTRSGLAGLDLEAYFRPRFSSEADSLPTISLSKTAEKTPETPGLMAAP